MWVEGDWIFTTPVGRPVTPNSDYFEWKALLKDAGYVTHAFTMPATPPRRCCSCSAFRSGLSWV